MVDLAVHTAHGGVAPIRSIAERQDLSDKYLECAPDNCQWSGSVDLYRLSVVTRSAARTSDALKMFLADDETRVS